MCQLLLMLVAFSQSDYTFPKTELNRMNGMSNGGAYVRHLRRDAFMVGYSWHDLSKEVRFTIRERIPSTGSYGHIQRKSESVSYMMTAVAPKYYDTLYVVGVKDDGVTVVERWKMTHSMVGALSVNRTEILSSSELTHLRACAVDPSESFLLAQKMETKDIIRIDLASGATEIVLTKAAYPLLEHYDHIEWMEHATNGDAFRISRMRNVMKQSPYNGVIYVWDDNLDGVPESVEDLTFEEEGAIGYADINVWSPLSEFRAGR